MPRLFYIHYLPFEFLVYVLLINLVAFLQNDTAFGTSGIRESNIAADTCWEEGQGSQRVCHFLLSLTRTMSMALLYERKNNKIKILWFGQILFE